MADPLINDLLSLGHSLGTHSGQLALAEEGALASRVTDSRIVVSRRGASLAELQLGDLVHLDFARMEEIISQDTVLLADLTGAQIHAEREAIAHEAAPLFVYLLGLDEKLKVAVHVHPVSVDQITASPRARQFADRRTVHNEVIALGGASLLVNYAEPGFALMREVQKKMILWRDRNKSVPRIILVQNHGVVILGEDASTVWRSVQWLLKFADVFIGASLLGGPVFLTPQAITQIELTRSAAEE